MCYKVLIIPIPYYFTGLKNFPLQKIKNFTFVRILPFKIVTEQSFKLGHIS